MAMNKREKDELARFGCALRAEDETFLIDWPTDRLRDAACAEILIRFSLNKLQESPIFWLAFEMSPHRFLPRYCYFPFDLTRQTHRRVIEGIVEKGSVKIALGTDAKVLNRAVQIPVCHLPKLLNQYRAAISELEALGPSRYNFGRALTELEATDRLPHYFARVLSEHELEAVVKDIGKDAAKVPVEKRELSRRFFEGLFEVVKTRYPDDVRLLFENLDAWQGFVQIVSDLYRDYGEDYTKIVEALADLAATTSEKQELEDLSPMPRALDSFCELLQRFRSSPKADRIEIFYRTVAALEEIRRELTSGFGVSQSLLRKTFAILGPHVRGKPGRRPEDYSFEYDQKAAGCSWTQVAMRSLESRPELRGEFGNKTYRELDYRQQAALKQRIRAGVESHARRTNRPLPPRSLPPKGRGGEEKAS